MIPLGSKNSPAGNNSPAGIRLRGGQSHRLETFVDAAFAFALTLLVISFDEVPASYDELLQAMRGVPAFLASFAIIVMLWIAHHKWSRTFGLEDALSQLISLLLVFVVMVYVYPLRAMMSVAMSSITGGWAPSGFQIDSLEQARGLFTIYGVGFAASTACLTLLYINALRHGGELGLTPYERAITRSEALVWTLVGSMGVISIVLAHTLPGNLLGLAGWVYSSLAFLTPMLAIYLGRRTERLRHST